MSFQIGFKKRGKPAKKDTEQRDKLQQVIDKVDVEKLVDLFEENPQLLAAIAPKTDSDSGSGSEEEFGGFVSANATIVGHNMDAIEEDDVNQGQHKQPEIQQNQDDGSSSGSQTKKAEDEPPAWMRAWMEDMSNRMEKMEKSKKSQQKVETWSSDEEIQVKNKGKGKGKSSEQKFHPKLASTGVIDLGNIPKQYVREEGHKEDICDAIESAAMEAYNNDRGHYGPPPAFGWGRGNMSTREPPKIDLNTTGSQFEAWMRQWEAHLNSCTNDVHPLKVRAFLKAQLDKAMTVGLSSWVYSQANLKDARPSEIIQAVKNRVFDRASVLTMAYKTLMRMQGDKEPIENVVMENNEVIRHFLAVYDNAENALGVLFLLIRCRTLQIRQRLLQDQEKSYDQLVQVAKNFEAQQGHAKDLYNIATSTIQQTHQTEQNEANVVHRNQGKNCGKSRGRSQSNWNRSRSRSKNPNCGWCGTANNRHPKEQCPARDKTCGKCKKIGHFTKVCRSRDRSQSLPDQQRGRSTEARSGPNSRNWQQGNEVETQSNELNIGMLEMDSRGSEEIEQTKTAQANTVQLKPKKNKKADNTIIPLSTVTAHLSDSSGHQTEVQALPDTGANVNIMPIETAKKFKYNKQDAKGPKCANGAQLHVVGEVITDVIVNDVMITDVKWHVADAHRLILSRKLIQQLGLIPSEFPFVQANNLENGNKTEEQNNTQMGSSTAPQNIVVCNDDEVNRIASKYPEVFCGKVTMMKGQPATIELSPDATPTSIGHFRTISDAYLQPLKKELDTQVEAGIIEKLENKPEAAKYWLHPIVVVPKKGTQDIRLCVDFRKLNKFCLRPVNPQKTPLETVRSLPKGEKYFAVCDALKGYHQVPLDEESKLKTAFYTPFGIYVYRSLPMGYAASQDIFTDRFGNAVDDLVQARVTEDCLITATDRQMFLKRIENFFKRCKEAGIVLNHKKVQIGSEVVFGGFKLNEEGYCLDPSLHDAIRKFPTPTNLTELRSFLGLINQTTSFTDKIAELASPLKELLKKKVDFVWTPEHQEAFEKARKELAEVKNLAYFDHRRPTKLFTDASRLNGLGFVVKQLQEDHTWRTVQAGSRFLTSAETRYAMVELELLAIAWACKKAAPFLEGIKFLILTDHKPLLPILNDYSLAEIENKRLQRLRMKLNGLRYEAHWVQGKENVEADALSRAPACQPTPEDEIDEEEIAELKTSKEAIAVLSCIEVNNEWIQPECPEFEACMVDQMAEEIRIAGEKDEDYRIVKGWLSQKYPPPRTAIEPQVDPYYRELERFSIDDNGLLCYEDRVVVPKPLRARYLDYLVNLHASPEKMKSRARKSIWWPFMANDISHKWRTCETCVERSPSVKKEPTKPRAPTSYPFQVVHMDLASYSGHQFLITVDQFSGWPVVKHLGKDAPTSRITQCLLQMFEQFGLPENIFSDGGPQFTSFEFQEFCDKWQISHETSSPHHPQSNGIAENAVKAMKKLLHCTYDPKTGSVLNDEWVKAIMLYKNTPWGPSKLSPSEVLFGRILRDGVVAKFEEYLPKHQEAVKKRRDEVQRYIDGIQKLRSQQKPLQKGEPVFVQDPQTKRWTLKGVIIGPGKNEREYMVQMQNGGRWRRNRKFLKRQGVAVKATQPSVDNTASGDRKVRFSDEEPRRSTRVRHQPDRFQAGSRK